MAQIYVDYQSGSDTLGSGTSASPYKTIARGLQQALVNDTVVVQGLNGAIHHEPDSIVIDGKLNITLQIEPFGHVVVKPDQVSEGATIVIRNSNGIKVIGLKYATATSTIGHKNAVLVENSTNIEIRDNSIANNWSCQNVNRTDLFHFSNSTVLATGNTSTYVEVAWPGATGNYVFSFMRLSGNGEYTLYNNSTTNVHSNSGYAYGLLLDSDVGRVHVDTFSVSEYIIDHVDYKDKMYGIRVNSDNSAPTVELNNIIINNMGIGIAAYNLPAGNSCIFKRLLISNCLYHSILADEESTLEIRNATITNSPNGLTADHRSALTAYNCIIYNCESAFRSNNDSYMKVGFSIYHECDNRDNLLSRGIADSSEFVRAINPKFINPSTPNYALADYSPGIDNGKNFGDAYIGNGPDIGYYERGSALTQDDLPSLLARKNRLSDRVPLTEIDIVGMVSKGIETSDGNILAGREGSAIKDIAVKPLDLLFTPYQTELEAIRDKLSFSQMVNLGEQDADLLAANVFTERDTGSTASGVVRLYFAEPTSAVVYAEHEFQSSGDFNFYARNTTSIIKDEMALNYENGAYYMDVVIDAEVESFDYNIEADEVTITTMPLPAGVISFTNPFAITGGRPKQTNEELYEKSKYSISVRDLVTKKGAKATLLERYPYVTQIQSIGFRDPEMERDFILGEHIGGKTDVYLKTYELIEDSRIVYPTSKYFEIKDETFGGFVPILKINRIEILEPLSEIETGIDLEGTVDFVLNPNAHYKLISYDSLHRYSIKEHLAIEFADSIVNDYMPTTPFKVYFYWVPEMKTIQDMMDDSEDRVVVADFLAKAFEPVFVSFGLNYLAREEITALEAALRGFIKGLPNGSELQESDLTAVAYMLGAQKVLQPITMRAEYYKLDGTYEVIESPDGIFIPRTSTFWGGDISVTYMGEEV